MVERSKPDSSFRDLQTTVIMAFFADAAGAFAVIIFTGELAVNHPEGPPVRGRDAGGRCSVWTGFVSGVFTIVLVIDIFRGH